MPSRQDQSWFLKRRLRLDVWFSSGVSSTTWSCRIKPRFRVSFLIGVRWARASISTWSFSSVQTAPWEVLCGNSSSPSGTTFFISWKPMKRKGQIWCIESIQVRGNLLFLHYEYLWIFILYISFIQFNLLQRQNDNFLLRVTLGPAASLNNWYPEGKAAQFFNLCFQLNYL
jgi:hypothetical protein